LAIQRFNEGYTLFFSWQSTRGYPTGRIPQATAHVHRVAGWQVYVPVGLQLVGRPDDFKVEVTTRSGYVLVAASPTFGAIGEVATPNRYVGHRQGDLSGT